jgi:DNA-binding MarR family transcriptional regulator
MPEASEQIADHLHSAAIHLLRRIRLEDSASGLTAPRLSALSVVVHAGPLSMADLATAEQIQAPSMTRLVAGLERLGLVARKPDPADGRRVMVSATKQGKVVLQKGKRRRILTLAKQISSLTPHDAACLAQAAKLMESLARDL